MTWITLDADDDRRATHVGLQRNRLNRDASEPDRAYRSDRSLGIDREGAGAELAFSKLSGVPWINPVLPHTQWKQEQSEFHPDVGPVEVRSTPHADGHLILQVEDPRDVPYFLVRAQYPRFEMVGWIYGYECKPEYWRESQPYNNIFRSCYMIPDAVLRPPDALLALLDTWGCTTCQLRCTWYAGNPPSWCKR